MHTPSEEIAREAPPPPPEPEPAGTAGRPHRRRRLVIALVALGACGLGLWVFLRARAPAKRSVPPPPVTVVAATAQRARLPVYLDNIGTVTPLRTTLVTSQVNGQVTRVHYAEGQLVKQGMLLVEINPRPFEATLLQAQGTLERDTHLLEQARMDLSRFREAWARNAIARQQLEDQEKLVLQAEGTVKMDRGAVEFDEIQLGFSRITAPISGRVGLRLVDPGNVVLANGATTLAVITQLHPITIVFTVSEDDLTSVLEQSRRGVELPVDAFDRARTRKLASGMLLTFDNQIDTTTGTVRLRAIFDNADGALFPNQFVNTRLLLRTIEDATTVPASAVQHDATQAFVYVLENARAHVRHVRTGVTEGDITQLEGIEPGTLVADSSFEKLQDNTAVTFGTPVASRGSTEGGPKDMSGGSP
jgi:multidrug efflux system membrane fusion protein